MIFLTDVLDIADIRPDGHSRPAFFYDECKSYAPVLTRHVQNDITELSINDKSLSITIREHDMDLNKEKAVKRINKAGKIGHIVMIVAEVITVVTFAALIFFSTMVAVVPKDFFSFKTSVMVTGMLDFSKVDEEASDEQIRESIDEIKKSGFAIFTSDPETGSDYRVEGTKVYFDTVTETSTFSFEKLSMAFVFLAVICFFSFFTLLCAGFLCKAFAKCNSPFDEEVIKKMRLFAISLIPWSVFSMLGNYMIAYMSGSPKVSLSINIAVVFTIVVIFALTYIFKYGAVLQQESDETL